MSGATDITTGLHVSTWGRYTDESGVEWQRWSVTQGSRRFCYLCLPVNLSAQDALIVAHGVYEVGVEETGILGDPGAEASP